ncbi:MAG: aspartate kinase [Flammeovirgaceae bacterium]|nr:aspartate kinase [Flammeovirgaceae bacterium]MDW8288261.1 aspartate kinase [Flammeovirgaceae bacterium]
MRVFKFGGASVKSAEAVQNIANIIRRYAEEKKLLIVVSAMGKTTNALEEVWKKSLQRENYAENIAQIKHYHLDIVSKLFADKSHPIYAHIEKLFFSLEQQAKKPAKDANQHYDQVVSYGEIISSTIVAAYLNEVGIETEYIDARQYIQTDRNWREGIVDLDWSEKLVKADLLDILQEKIILTQGFIGGTIGMQTTTLGREGSDYSAAIFAYCLDADSVTIWKDVPGILNADPRRIKNTKMYERLTYLEAAEMTYFGASVIHPKTIRPLALKDIPLNVRSFIHPEEPGTSIGNFEQENTVPAIIFKPKQSILKFEERDFLNVNRADLGTIFDELALLGIKINMMMNSAITFTICADTEPEKFKKIEARLSEEFNITMHHNLELITVKNCRGVLPPELVIKGKVWLRQETEEDIQLVVDADESFKGHKA